MLRTLSTALLAALVPATFACNWLNAGQATESAPATAETSVVVEYVAVTHDNLEQFTVKARAGDVILDLKSTTPFAIVEKQCSPILDLTCLYERVGGEERLVYFYESGAPIVTVWLEPMVVAGETASL